MKIALIGATGYVGSAVLGEALSRGHRVTAIVRDVTKLPEHEQLVPLAVDVHDEQPLADALRGHDAVISCFNPGGHDVGAVPTAYRDIVEGTQSIIAASLRAEVQHLVYVGGAGSLLVPPGIMLVDAREFLVEHLQQPPVGMLTSTGPPSLDIPRGARIAYYLFERQRDLSWCFVSPSLCLGNYGGRTGRLRYGEHELLMENGSPARVDVEDLAIAVVEEAETASHVRGHLTVATEGLPPA